MKNLYRISLALLAMGMLAVAGSAFAQDAPKPTFTITSSSAGAAFGIYTFDKTAQGTIPAASKGFSEVVTSWESRPRLTWTTDSFYALVSIRIRGSTEGAGFANSPVLQAGANNALTSTKNDVYSEGWWTPGAFKLGIGKFQGQDWNQPISGTYLVRNEIGDGEYWLNWTGIPGIDAEYNFGIWQLGIAASSVCNPSCNFLQSNTATTNKGANAPGSMTPAEIGQVTAEDNTMTIAPHIAGKVGDIAFRAMLLQTSATLNATSATTFKPGTATTTKSVSGSGYQAGVKWFGPAGWAAGADIGSFNDAKLAALSENKSRERDSYNVRVDIPGGPGYVTLAYFSIGDNVSGNGTDSPYTAKGGTHTYTSSTATLRYNYVLPFGVVTPEYRAATIGGGMTPTSGTKQKDQADSEFRLIMNWSL